MRIWAGLLLWSLDVVLEFLDAFGGCLFFLNSFLVNDSVGWVCVT